MELKILDNINDDIVKIRREAFVYGRSVPEEIEFDGKDSSLKHFCLYDNDVLIAYLRSEDMGDFIHIGRVAVKKDRRAKGLGRVLFTYLFDYAKEKGFTFIELSAVKTAQGFYEKMGFSPFGEYYLETGTEHIYMKKTIIL